MMHMEWLLLIGESYSDFRRFALYKKSDLSSDGSVDFVLMVIVERLSANSFLSFLLTSHKIQIPPESQIKMKLRKHETLV